MKLKNIFALLNCSLPCFLILQNNSSLYRKEYDYHSQGDDFDCVLNPTIDVLLFQEEEKWLSKITNLQLTAEKDSFVALRVSARATSKTEVKIELQEEK